MRIMACCGFFCGEAAVVADGGGGRGHARRGCVSPRRGAGLLAAILWALLYIAFLPSRCPAQYAHAQNNPPVEYVIFTMQPVGSVTYRELLIYQARVNDEARNTALKFTWTVLDSEGNDLNFEVVPPQGSYEERAGASRIEMRLPAAPLAGGSEPPAPGDLRIKVKAENRWGMATATTSTEFDPCGPCSEGDCHVGNDTEPAIDIRQGPETPPAAQDPQGQSLMTATSAGTPQTVGRIALRPDALSNGVEVGFNVDPESLLPHGENPLLHQVGTLAGVTVVEQIPEEQRAVVRFYAHAKMSEPDAQGWRDPLQGQEPEHWTSLQRVKQHDRLPFGAAFGYLLRRSVGGNVEYTLYSLNTANPDDSSPPPHTRARKVWNLVRGNEEDGAVLQRIVNTDHWSGSTRFERQEIRGADGLPQRVNERRRHYLGGGSTLWKEERIKGAGVARQLDVTHYHTSALNPHQFGLISSRDTHRGEQIIYEYDTEGRLKSESHCIPGDDTSTPLMLTYIYDLLPGEESGLYPLSPRTTIETRDGVEISRTYSAWSVGEGTIKMISERAAKDALYGDTANQRTTRWIDNGSDPEAPGYRKPVRVEYHDGRLDRHSYEFGTFDAQAGEFTPSTGGSLEQHILTRGTVSAPDGIANRTTREVTISRRDNGNTLLRETQVYTGDEYETIAWTAQEYDNLGKLKTTTHSDGRVETVQPGCCGPTRRTAADGSVESYFYDALGRLEMIVREGAPEASGAPEDAVTITRTFDAAGRVIATETSAGGLTRTTSTEYDLLGRVVKSTDEQGRVSTTTYSVDGLTVTRTSPSGAVTGTVSHPDGRVKEQTGTGQATTEYTYGVENTTEGGVEAGWQWTLVEQGDTWQQTWTDAFGRTVRTEQPGYGSTTIVSTSDYNNAGRLVKSTRTGSPDTLYDYDAEIGELLHTALDLNEIEVEGEIVIGNGAIDFAGPDRVQGQESRYEKIGDDWYRVQRSFTYPEDGSDEQRDTSLSYTRLTGLRVTGDDGMLVSESYQVDPLAPGYNPATPLALSQAARSQTWIHRNTKTVTSRSSSPDSQPSESVAVSVNGNLISQTTAAGLTYTFAYDALGQRTESTDPRTGPTSYTYDDDVGRLTKVTDPAGNATQFGYDLVTGERTTVTDAMNQVTHTAYDQLGRVIATWGATYPVAYEYDGHGRMIAMATTRIDSNDNDDFETLAGQLKSGTSITSLASTWSLDVTRWEYEGATGLLERKLYPLAPPDTESKGPTYTYKDNGQLETRAWARRVEVETVTVFVLNEFIDIPVSLLNEMENSDRSLEDIVLEMQNCACLLLMETPVTTTYTYTAAGELASVSYNDGTQGTTFTYDRLGRQVEVTDALGMRTFAYDSATLALVSETLDDGTVIEREPDALGRPSALKVKEGVSLPATYQVGYAYDTFGRFASVTHGSHTASYAYVPKSGLVAGYTIGDLSRKVTYESNRNLVDVVENKYDTTTISKFDYTNDAIGRRTARKDTGSVFLSTQHNAFVHNIRSEVERATMQNGLSTYEYDPIGNRKKATLPEEQASLVYAANERNQYTSITGRTAPAHDDDGNMLDDGAGLAMTWDAENRLIETVKDGQTVTYTYDYMSRRVAKTVGNVTHEYIYDGWNLIRETIINQQSKIKNHYVWGLDLSQSLQGAGGVGGLLAAVHGANVYYPCFDANGNITQYVDSSSGNEVARYDYDAFGREFHSSGDLANDFVFRFSTKYTDTETGLVYYGYRFFNPELGRWINRDPIGEEGGLNLYGFVGNGGIDALDLVGLKTWYVNTRVSWMIAGNKLWSSGYETPKYIGYTKNAAKLDTQDCCKIELNRSLDQSVPDYKAHVKGWFWDQWHSFATMAVGDVSSGACECDGKSVDGIEINVYHVYSTGELVTITLGAEVGAEIGINKNAKVSSGVNVGVTIPPTAQQSKPIKTYLICPTGGAMSQPSVTDKGLAITGGGPSKKLKHYAKDFSPWITETP